MKAKTKLASALHLGKIHPLLETLFIGWIYVGIQAPLLYCAMLSTWQFQVSFVYKDDIGKYSLEDLTNDTS